MQEKIDINVNSEIGELEAVILHRPGSEVENMTPKNAERALYSDILNLSVAQSEYSELEKILNKFAATFQVKDLLKDIVTDENVKRSIIQKLCTNENICNLNDYLLNLESDEFARQIIEGVPLKKDTLTGYLSDERYSLQPLHNFFYMRDASVTVRNKVLISNMANKVREREALIMQAIFDNHPKFNAKTVNLSASNHSENQATFEGGDVLVAREDILIIGNSVRTTPQGIDAIVNAIKETNGSKHILVQELPYKPESFIHLDMVFTFIDKAQCMIFEPLILNSSRFLCIHIHIENGKVVSIKEEKNLLSALSGLGMDLEPISCGGRSDLYVQEREQWHSGANFFALAPGKVIGYDRNTYTLNEMNKFGFEILDAKDIINDKVDVHSYNKCVVTIKGSELSRGGGGARCMTMPVARKRVDW
ncbi:MAG: hypothetical protein K9J13_14685 [Saprospiraceae bacterium]|nr:hypothetical protein [Saprospiraceae bacterium]